MHGGARRLNGLRAAQIAIDDMIKEARAAINLGGKQQGRTAGHWKGRFDGLVCASAMLTLADFPEQPENAAQIKRLLK